jgi:transcriptional antiterminator RfaH
VCFVHNRFKVQLKERQEMQKWYAVMAKPRKEQASISFLKQVGIETYYPEVTECLSVKGRRSARRVGLFPGYFFAKFDHDKQYRMVSFCRGVRKVVTFGQVPAEIEPDLLDDIRRGLSRQDIIPSLLRPTHGEVVRISHGLLAGVEAIFDSCLSGKERVVVLLRALSYQSRAIIKLSDIEWLSEAV